MANTPNCVLSFPVRVFQLLCWLLKQCCWTQTLHIYIPFFPQVHSYELRLLYILASSASLRVFGFCYSVTPQVILFLFFFSTKLAIENVPT